MPPPFHCVSRGNVLDNAGYACMLPTMIANWRKMWSHVPGTTDPDAPFGVQYSTHYDLLSSILLYNRSAI